MRWIVISLVLVNALIFGWRWLGGKPAESPPATRRPAAAEPAIELLPDGSVEPALTASAEISLPTETAAGIPSERPVEGQAAVADDLAVPPTTASDVLSMPSSSPVASTDAAASSAPVPETVSGNSTATEAIAANTTALSQSAAERHTTMSCGWSDWQAKPASLSAGIEVLHEEQREQELGRSYLVYIAGKADREQTLSRLAEVKALGFEAAFLNKGPQLGGISLGLFSKPESMQIRLRELKQAGVEDARGVERVRTETQHRRLLRWTGEKTPTVVQNQALVSCNDVASPST